MSTKSFGVVLSCTLVVLSGCADVPTMQSTAAPLADAARASRFTRAADSVLLAMRVVDGSSYRVQSDGLGEYVHGSASMAATIDVYGNLQIAPAAPIGALPAARRLNITYAAGQPDTYPNQVNFKITSNRTNNGNPRLQDMPVGSALCYNVTIAHRDNAVQLVNRYNPAAYPASTYVLVVRGSSTSWTLASQGTATTGLACGVADYAWVTGTALLVKRGGSFTVGAEAQGFLIELRALP